LVGGVAKTLLYSLAYRKLGFNVKIPEYPDYVGAFGAALIAIGRVKGGA
jgi:activator of 2-hydroxyglutaryl-CoA dehydratase